MGRKLLSFLMAVMLLISSASTALAAESGDLPETPHSHSEAEQPHEHEDSHADCEHTEAEHAETDHEEIPPIEPEPSDKPTESEPETPTPAATETEPAQPEAPPTEPEQPEIPAEGEPESPIPVATPTNAPPEIPPIKPETPGYILLETRSGEAVVMFGAIEDAYKPIHQPRIIGRRPCAFLDCKNTVTVRTKYDFVCNAHKCSVSGCSNPAYNLNPNKCQFHARRTDTICQIYTPSNPDGLCGKPSVSKGSICCWEHHCPGCLGIGKGNATVCDICKQCWVPGCANFSTCTNECDDHCPHNCKTHHQTHCLDCHSDPCICYPANPAINMRAWNGNDNSVAVDISSDRATAIELYTAGGVMFATFRGTSGTHIFRYNAAQNNGSYYVRVKNAKGYNSSNFPFQVSGLDKAPPGIEGKTVQPGNEVWTTEKTLTVTATDQTNARFSLRYADGSAVPGCGDKEGSKNGSKFTASWTITEPLASAKTFRIIATDRWGHTSETTVSLSGIDRTKPTATYTLTPDDWTTGQVTINFKPTDSGGSGLACVTLPDGKTVTDFAKIQFPVTQNGDYSFALTDKAGNSATIPVTVGNIVMLDVTVTLNAPFVISPDNDRLYSGDISFQNHSNVPVSLTLQRMTAYGNAPGLVGRDEKPWKNLTVTDTRKYLALGLLGNGAEVWAGAAKAQSLGIIAKGGAASYTLQGRFGYAWEQAERFLYGMTVKIAVAQ